MQKRARECWGMIKGRCAMPRFYIVGEGEPPKSFKQGSDGLDLSICEEGRVCLVQTRHLSEHLSLP